MRKMDVLCIGHAAYDLVLPLEDYPAENSKTEIHLVLEAGGGPAANAAYLLSKWGADCAFAGLVGDDPYGCRIRQELEQAGTDVSLLELRHGYVTPLSVILVNTGNGSRTIVNRKVPNSFLNIGAWTPAKWDTNMNKTAACDPEDSTRPHSMPDMKPRVLLFDGHEPQASLKAMTLFPYAVTILDAGSLREGTEVLSKKMDYLVCSERFALQVTGLSDLRSRNRRKECMIQLSKLGSRQVTVTLGEKGLLYAEKNRFYHMPAYPANTVDTTAAGDIFHGAFTYGILKGMDLSDTLKLASMTSALSVSIPGGRQSIPSLEQVRSALVERDGMIDAEPL